MKKILKLATIIGLLSMPFVAKAQDFYNGCKGPNGVMIDSYVNYTGNQASTMIVPKVFGKNISKKLPDFLVAAPTVITNRGLENKGINLGYAIENLYGSNAVIAAGIFKDAEGKYAALTPQLYLNRDFSKISVDIEGNMPIHLESQERGGFLAATAGYGLTDRLRLGASIMKSEGQDATGQLLFRYETKKDHSCWIQGYLRPDQIQGRLVWNLF